MKHTNKVFLAVLIICCLLLKKANADTQHNGPKLDIPLWEVKKIENTFKRVKERLYFAETEITNQQYNYFLIALLQEKNFELLNQVKAEKTAWKSLLPEKYKTLDDKILFKHGHPDGDFMPAQNMTYESAIEFCKWLTNTYNQEDPAKRKWKKVIFRLPTESEWEFAALAGKKQVNYPWGGPDYRNLKGCFLSNFNSLDEPCKTCTSELDSKDGGFFTVQGNTYFPNEFGLYGMSGNVAEMVQTKGIAKGGSWEDLPVDCTIQSQKKYSAPSPAIGFRILMEIIE
ncbi:MAG: SUMF1/EgtB/PvdO family nonheme iron enzyme [Saprospiraceae bacterium]